MNSARLFLAFMPFTLVLACSSEPEESVDESEGALVSEPTTDDGARARNACLAELQKLAGKGQYLCDGATLMNRGRTKDCELGRYGVCEKKFCK